MLPILGPGHEHFRDAPRPDHPPHDGHSPASRERSSSLQGMDMASLPPRKRPWHDGPGTSEHREMDAPGGPSEDRGGKGKWGWWLQLGSCGCYSPAKKASGLLEAPSQCMPVLSVPTGAPPTGVLGVLYPPGLRLQRYVFPIVVQPVGDCKLSLCTGLLHLPPAVPGLFTFYTRALFQTVPVLSLLICETLALMGRCALVMTALSPQAVVRSREDYLLSGSVPLFLEGALLVARVTKTLGNMVWKWFSFHGGSGLFLPLETLDLYFIEAALTLSRSGSYWRLTTAVGSGEAGLIDKECALEAAGKSAPVPQPGSTPVHLPPVESLLYRVLPFILGSLVLLSAKLSEITSRHQCPPTCTFCCWLGTQDALCRSQAAATWLVWKWYPNWQLLCQGTMRGPRLSFVRKEARILLAIFPHLVLAGFRFHSKI